MTADLLGGWFLGARKSASAFVLRTCSATAFVVMLPPPMTALLAEERPWDELCVMFIRIS